MLHYASPVVTPVRRYITKPAHSLFTLDATETGVRLSRSVPARPFLASVLIFTASICGLVAIGGCWRLFLDRSGPTNLTLRLVLITVFIAVAAGLVFKSLRHVRRRTLLIELCQSRLLVINAQPYLGRMQWTIPCVLSFRARRGSIDLIKLRPSCDLLAVNPSNYGRSVLRRLSEDECLWLAAVLNSALQLAKRTALAGAGTAFQART